MVSALFALALPSSAATNQTSDRTYVIELVDSTGEETYQAVPMEQYHRLRAETGTRNRFQAKALAQTKEEWKATYNGISKAFPSNVATPESVTSFGLFTSEDAARTKLMELRAKAKQKRESDGDKLTSIEKQIQALKESIQRLNATPGNSITDKDAKIHADRLALRILEHDAAEQLAKKTRQEEDLSEARKIYEKKLTALVSSATK